MSDQFGNPNKDEKILQQSRNNVSNSLNNVNENRDSPTNENADIGGPKNIQDNEELKRVKALILDFKVIHSRYVGLNAYKAYKASQTLTPKIQNVSTKHIFQESLLTRPVSALVVHGQKQNTSQQSSLQPSDSPLLSFINSDSQCFVSSYYNCNVPLMVSLPFSANLRHQSFQNFVSRTDNTNSNNDNTEAFNSDFWKSYYHQNIASDKFPKNSLPSQTNSNINNQLANWRNFTKPSKPLVSRNVKSIEREERRRKQDKEMEERKRRRWSDFHKTIMNHRDDFLRFHKNKRSELSKLSKAVRNTLEQGEARKEKDEVKAEARRMQALRENDMVEYTRLLQNTKNDRLHFLVSQTDKYLQDINRIMNSSSDQLSGIKNDKKKKSKRKRKQSSESKNNDDKMEVEGVEGADVQKDDNIDNKEDNKQENNDKDNNNGGGGEEEEESEGEEGDDEDEDEDDEEDGKKSSSNNYTSASLTYYSNIHKKQEVVVQPRSMVGGELKEYQLLGIQWMVSLYNNNSNGILADEMGLGKTIQTIGLLSYLMENKRDKGPFLVVVPLSTLSNWVNEFSKWAPHIIKVLYKGPPASRKLIFKEQIEPIAFNVLLTTYEYVMKDKGQLKKLKWKYIIVDEGHRMKNAESKFAQTLGQEYKSKYKLLLTGTPLQNNLPELWALLNFLLPDIFGSMDTFEEWFSKPFSSFKNSNDASLADGVEKVISQEEKMLVVHRLHEMIRPFMLRRVKDQVLDLPDKVEKILRCQLSGFQKRLYHAIHTRSVAGRLQSAGMQSGSLELPADDEIDGEGRNASSGLNNAIMQLRKVCNHPYLFLDEWYVDEDLIRCSGKFELLDRMLPKLKKTGHRILMFSQMTQVMTILERFFEYRGYQHLRLDGSTSSEERERRMALFNEPESPYFIFLLSTRAGGLGLNLASADTVILFDSDWNPMMDAQAQDRAHRIGQKKEVRVFRIITASPVEERILARATDKRTLNGLVVEAGKFGSAQKQQASATREVLEEQRQKEQMIATYLNEMSGSANALNANGGASASSVAASANAAVNEGEGEELCEDLEDEEEGELETGGGADEVLNAMMATSEEELAVYRQVDAERAVGSSTGLPVRRGLMQGTEEPAWLSPRHWAQRNALLLGALNRDRDQAFSDNNNNFSGGGNDSVNGGGNGGGASGKKGKKKGAQAESAREEGEVRGGKLMRKRKEVAYADNLSDGQFVRMLESDGFSASNTTSGTTSDGRARLNSAAALRSFLESPLSTSFSASPESVGVLRPLSEAQLLALERIIKSELAAVASADGQRDASQLFLALPDKHLYPDYRALVVQPVSFKEMRARLASSSGSRYSCLAALELDLALLCVNAATYNSRDSFVFADARLLRGRFYALCHARGVLRSLGLRLGARVAGAIAHCGTSLNTTSDDAWLDSLPPLPNSFADLVQQAESGSFVCLTSIQSACVPVDAREGEEEMEALSGKKREGESDAKKSAKKGRLSLTLARDDEQEEQDSSQELVLRIPRRTKS